MDAERPMGFHAKHGWHFKRLEPGGFVSIVYWPQGETQPVAAIHDLDPATWATIVATVSGDGANGKTFARALALHAGSSLAAGSSSLRNPTQDEAACSTSNAHPPGYPFETRTFPTEETPT